MVQPDIELEETYTIETYHETRNIYRYRIEHDSIDMSKEEKEQESKLFKELYSRHAQLMASQIGTEMSLLPKRNELFVYSFCEIVSTREFEYDSLYVVYSLDLPDGWTTDNYECLTGVTHRCSMNKVSKGLFVSYLWTLKTCSSNSIFELGEFIFHIPFPLDKHLHFYASPPIKKLYKNTI